MNIGTMFRNDSGSVTGSIAEPTYAFRRVYLEKVESDNPRAPQFDLMTPTPIGTPFRLGSIWERTSEGTGEVYFGGYIESSASGYGIIRLFRSKKNPQQWFIVRNDVPGAKRSGAQQADLPEAGEAADQYDHVFGRELEDA